jgi:hypothetical protein
LPVSGPDIHRSRFSKWMHSDATEPRRRNFSLKQAPIRSLPVLSERQRIAVKATPGFGSCD